MTNLPPLTRRKMLAAASTLALSACGFELRGTPEFVFKTLFTRFPEGSPLGREFARTMASTGAVELISDLKQMDRAEAILDVLADQRERSVVGQSGAGQVREFQLRQRFRFRLRSRDGRELLEETELVQMREISFNESAVLAKESEQEFLYRDMQTEIVQQLMRRLAAVKRL